MTHQISKRTPLLKENDRQSSTCGQLKNGRTYTERRASSYIHFSIVIIDHQPFSFLTQTINISY